MNTPQKIFLDALRSFQINRGLLLAGAIAYNALLSLIPLLAITLVILSQLFDPAKLLQIISESLSHFAPNQVEIIIDQLNRFISNWRIVGIVGVIMLFVFSSLAFSILESAMQVIFHRRSRMNPRHFIVSIGLPYLYMFALVVGLTLFTLVITLLQTLPHNDWFTAHSGIMLYLLSIIGEVLVLTSFYKILPAGKVAWSHAVIGGVFATLLWEIARTVLVWYLSTLSLVNVIYGTFATTIIILLCFEIAAVILLFGAQLIAVYESHLEELD